MYIHYTYTPAEHPMWHTVLRVYSYNNNNNNNVGATGEIWYRVIRARRLEGDGGGGGGCREE